ncbi:MULTISPECIES: arginine--tRNA ligase [unclassified Undibacterium]|uniref:arginine--tRNA ligase n=1 Tax=unclassified Undibacterium TaxID=2630295 RepID=UPI002AC9DD1A|nr:MULTISPECIES: arginine--tRNA ligase [unclassified Undibacterium]MEB0138961.1 arginine--tRNA ligase [Undibacterium sp. CCC2.1]MEB0171708.1 arginine--tRNA ligase [Undibacterium sp. CCC1.1]MEB0175592.1 arginine--tRNA ligase [Undibacterium sp. CCC3.4]MEB0214910.1 arginine--tRNA ligase [Undibacterium sp. 5I2]WPX44895.1 arginine--tRNA ligase [Undibacterium sp. CCC3.4]
MLAEQKQEILRLLQQAVAPLIADTSVSANVLLERPRDAAHGDIACNIAMQIAKPLRKNPREIAQQIVASLEAAAHPLIAAVEIAGPGFINIRLATAAKQAIVKTVLTAGVTYGQSRRGAGQKVVVEFVSANPTGPLHVGHGRQGALGDALAALLDIQGYAVTREFYYNDAGVQIANLGLSVQARANGHAPGDPAWPETAYNGDYIAEIARDFLDKKTVSASNGVPVTANGDVNDLESIRAFAVTYLRREQDSDLLAFGVKFDHYYLESSLYVDGKVAATVAALTAAGKTYEQDGALWLRTTEYGDDKDRVMKKSDGTYTYFVPDVAYHVSKWERGYRQAINIQGSDHHGTIARVRAGLQALDVGIPQGYPDYILHKMVTVMKDGAEVKISKRAGSYVTVRDLIDWSGNGDVVRGRDAVRFFLISRKADTEFVFDVDVALSQSDENPVYYVQYAHARICSVLAQYSTEEAGFAALAEVDLTPLTAPREASLLAKLAEYPEALERALDELGPHQVAFYLRDLAGELHSYYNAERVLVDDEAVKLARLALMLATRQVIRNGLALIGVSAPPKM